ncbi:MAG TPA: transcription elongation factor Spt5 [Candidatus Thermoplasmatota archaeon]|nr:transcription elongation factor Spt5 [Candidatus Thermoplasmatota archaeon]
MEGDDGLGILPTKEELLKKADAKPKPAPAVVDADEASIQPAPRGSKKKAKKSLADVPEPVERTGTTILVLKTQVGQERRVAEALGNKARRFGLPILGLLAPAELRGYVFIETDDPVRAEKGVRGISYARALIKDPMTNQPRDTPFTEIAHFLTPVSAVAKIAEGDIVELVSGPFRGEKAKVTRVDDTREEITVELIESMVPIPITVKGEHVRVLQRGNAQ